MQERDLAARATEALHAVRARGEQQQARRAVVADLRQIDRQLFSFRAALAGVHVPGAPGAACFSRGEELAARLGVALGEMGGYVHGCKIQILCVGFQAPSGSACSASAAR